MKSRQNNFFFINTFMQFHRSGVLSIYTSNTHIKYNLPAMEKIFSPLWFCYRQFSLHLGIFYSVERNILYAGHICLSFCLWSGIGNTTVCWIFMRFVIIIVYTSLYSKCEFYKNWLGYSHILLKGMHELLSLLPTCLDWFGRD
jgi:hypothetical protein